MEIIVCGIYKIVNPKGKIYIGQSVNIRERFFTYKRLECKNQPKIYNSLVKHGADKHKFVILCECKKEELNNLEIYYIELYQTFNNKFGLNLKEGGGQKNTYSQESRKKMSEVQKQKYINGYINPNTGRALSEERKLKMSLALKGKQKSPEQQQKLRTYWIGRKHKKESLLKMQETKIRNGTNFVKEETKNKISKTLMGRPSLKGILVINLENGIFYNSVTEAASSSHLTRKGLHYHLDGKSKYNNTNFAYAN